MNMIKKANLGMKAPYRRWLLFVMLIPGLFVFVNHAEQVRKNRELSLEKTSQFTINQEGGYSGHEIIGIQEETLPAHEDLLRFSDLAEWTDPNSTPCPEKIMRSSGKMSTVVGFMYPLQSGSKLKTFCLLRSTQTCCYGARPQFNQYLLVEMKAPVLFERLKPVMVKGIFVVEPKIEEGYVYRMEGQAVFTPGQREFEDFIKGESKINK